MGRSQLRIEEQIRLAEDQEQARRYPCGHYRPDPVDGRPDPPASECKWCKAAAEGNRPQLYDRRVVDPDPTVPRQYQIAEAFYEKHPEKRPGGPLSDDEKDKLLEMIDAQREEEIGREHAHDRRQGRLISGRIERGYWVEYRNVPGVGIVKVSPE